MAVPLLKPPCGGFRIETATWIQKWLELLGTYTGCRCSIIAPVVPGPSYPFWPSPLFLYRGRFSVLPNKTIEWAKGPRAKCARKPEEKRGCLGVNDLDPRPKYNRSEIDPRGRGVMYIVTWPLHPNGRLCPLGDGRYIHITVINL
jgi:hypothetical protein